MFTLQDLSLHDVAALTAADALSHVVKINEARGSSLKQPALPVSETFAIRGTTASSLSGFPAAIADKMARMIRQVTSPTQPLESWMVSQDSLLRDIAKMEALRRATRAYGIAANQLGHHARACIVACWPLDHAPERPHLDPTVLIDPLITEVSTTTQTNPEKCLSIPDAVGLVTRPLAIRFTHMDVHGTLHHDIPANGYLAAVIQHEIDHLDGRTILDHTGLLFTDTDYQRYKTTKTWPTHGLDLSTFGSL